MAHDIIIIGAGVAGLGMAWRLAEEGHDVVVLEKDEAGAGASTAAAGMLAPTAEVRFEEVELLQMGQRSLELWPDFARTLEEASGMSIDYRTEGTLVVAVDRDDLAAIEHLHRYHAELGLPATMLDGDEARQLEPGLAPSIPGAVHCPDDHQVNPDLLVEALVTAFGRAGGDLREGVEVERVIAKDGSVEAVETTSGERLEARVVVLAAGAWSRKIDGLGPDRPQVRPVRGQMIALELGEPELCRHVLRAPDAYLVPRSNGELVIGATMEEMGWDDRLTAGGVFELLRGAWETLPGIYDAPIVGTWTGFRPMTLDNHPIIGWGEQDGLYVATGHGRNGILLTALTAERAAREVGERLR